MCVLYLSIEWVCWVAQKNVCYKMPFHVYQLQTRGNITIFWLQNVLKQAPCTCCIRKHLLSQSFQKYWFVTFLWHVPVGAHLAFPRIGSEDLYKMRFKNRYATEWLGPKWAAIFVTQELRFFLQRVWYFERGQDMYHVTWPFALEKTVNTKKSLTSSDPHRDKLSRHSFWRLIWNYIWHIFSDTLFGHPTWQFILFWSFLTFYLASILTSYLASFSSGMFYVILNHILSDILSGICSGIHSGILSGILSVWRIRAPVNAPLFKHAISSHCAVNVHFSILCVSFRHLCNWPC